MLYCDLGLSKALYQVWSFCLTLILTFFSLPIVELLRMKTACVGEVLQ